MKKRILTLAMALVMCVGLLPASAAGLDTDDILALLPDDPGVPVMTDVTQTMFWERNEELWIYSKTEEEVFSELEDLTHELTRGKSSDTEKAKAIYDWVSQNIKYDREGLKSQEFFYRCAIYSGIHTFARRKGVCGGYAQLVSMMCIITGLPVTYVYGYVGSVTEPHAWNAVYADGRWIFFDTVITGWDLDANYLNRINRRMYEIRVFGRFNCRTYDKFYISEQRGFAFPETGITPGLTNIEMDAFFDCQDIDSVVIPKSITYCGNTVFRDCKNLKTIEFEEGCNPEMYREAFAEIPGLETVIIPGSLKKLGVGMFERCDNLKNVIISDGVETISDHAFDSCKSLKSITLPNSVKTIENGAFYLCKSLESVYVPGSVTSIEGNAFQTYCSKGTTIYTEPGSYAESYAKENKIKVVTTGETPTPAENPTPADSAAPSAWAQAEVSGATQAGLVPSDLLSSYTSAITRGEFCRLMVKLIEANSGKDIAGYVASKGKNLSAPFTDTAAQEVTAAYALGIVNGVSATKFNPSGYITRQEAAAMLERTAKLLGLSTGSGISFSDSGSIASWAAGSVAFLSGLTDPVNSNKVMGGVGSGKFDPAGTYTREQAIATTLRLFHCAG